jgi:hypothetical protein
VVAVKAGRLYARDIWPDGLWSEEDWQDMWARLESQYKAEGMSHPEAFFKARHETAEYYKRTMPRWGERQKIMARLYPPKKSRRISLDLTEDEVLYLKEKLEGVNHPTGRSILEKLTR